MADIAFIGLGNMGGPMARNLVQAGQGVVGFDVAASAPATPPETGASSIS